MVFHSSVSICFFSCFVRIQKVTTKQWTNSSAQKRHKNVMPVTRMNKHPPQTHKSGIYNWSSNEIKRKNKLQSSGVKVKLVYTWLWIMPNQFQHWMPFFFTQFPYTTHSFVCLQSFFFSSFVWYEKCLKIIARPSQSVNYYRVDQDLLKSWMCDTSSSQYLQFHLLSTTESAQHTWSEWFQMSLLFLWFNHHHRHLKEQHG